MKRLISYISIILVTFLFTACGGAKYSLTPEQQKIISSNETVYTQVNMWAEGKRTFGTNFSKGLLIPINTELKIISVDGKRIVFEYLGAQINYEVYTKHTQLNSEETMSRLFSTKKVDLSKFSKKVQNNILSGKIAIGMTKDEVLLARGYPPAHVTIALEVDTWKYWQHRFRTMRVEFKNGKVVNIIK